MKLLIAGSRKITDRKVLDHYISQIMPKVNITTIISGCAAGIDALGEEWAKDNNCNIIYFPAAWDKYGQDAGFIRTEEMVDYMDAALIIWDGRSPGTKFTIECCNKSKKPTFVGNLYKYDNK
jgi:hypothetical protein